jgi:mannose/fructose/N-acetylgalactosamine-specific phosphotransferase system component IIC
MGSISGAFALVALIGGLFCRRLKTALIIGAVPALLYVALVVIGLWSVLPDTDLAFVLGSLTGASLAIVLFAALGFYLRRGIAWILDAARNRSFWRLSR